MAKQRKAADEDELASGGSPFTRPGFIVSAVVVALIVVLGVTMAVRAAREDKVAEPGDVPTAADTSSPTMTPAADTKASVCGLSGDQTRPPIAPPAVTWAFQGTIPYPSSPDVGPGKTSPDGYRFCFQRSAAGAVVMAANAIAQGSDPQLGDAWAEYALGSGRYRAELAHKIGTATGADGTRLKVVGFRVLDYSDDAARVDLALEVSAQNQTLTMSTVYELVWENGDWKISADVPRPLDTASIPDASGYTPWGDL